MLKIIWKIHLKYIILTKVNKVMKKIIQKTLCKEDAKIVKEQVMKLMTAVMKRKKVKLYYFFM